MCSHKWWAIVILIAIFLGFIVIQEAITHQPKVVTETKYSCNKPKTQSEIEKDWFITAQQTCNNGVDQFSMDRERDGTYHPNIRCN